MGLYICVVNFNTGVLHDLLSSESQDTFLVYTSMGIDFKSGLQVLTISSQCWTRLF